MIAMLALAVHCVNLAGCGGGVSPPARQIDYAVTGQMQEFVFRADKSYRSVTVAGTFNGWNKGATPLKLDKDGKTWRVKVDLQPGHILYKFVLDDTDWITDPTNKHSEDDGNGHTNSLLLLLPAGYDKPAAANDGTITVSALRHQPDGADLNYDRGYLKIALRARPHDIARLSVQCASGDPLAKVHRRRVRIPLKEEPIDELYSRWETMLPWDDRGEVQYTFVVDDGNGSKYFGPNGLTDDPNNQFTLDAATYHPAAPPKWIEGSVVYQIFPDRFANGDPRNDPNNVKTWGESPQGSDYFGGDVAGISQHIDYLKNLGIRAIYFNPIFQSPVSHRYETSDYRKIDARFGTNEEFFDLTKALKKNGIKTILDGVFNHSATDFFAFKDILQNQQSSKYCDWYTVKSFPVKVQENPPYEAWWNYQSMPKLHVMNPAVKAYLLDSVSYWQKNAEIGGWRLDAANEVPMEFWQAFRQRVKSLNPDAWILGEEWGDASGWLKGDQWDASMNYPFREALLKFVGSTGNAKPSDLLNGLMRVYRMYAPQVSRNQFNLLGSHDTPRILTLCGGDKDLAKLAATIQMTWVGVPSIYYGDEIGMAGGADPDDRRCMDWAQVNGQNDFLSLYRKLIATRESSALLRSGDPVPLMANDNQGTLAYARVLDGRAAIVAVNRSDEAKTIEILLAKTGLPKGSFQAGFTEALGGSIVIPTGGTIRLQMRPKCAGILLPTAARTSTPQYPITSIHQYRIPHSPFINDQPSLP